jgi:hypothetical protein
MDASAQGWRDSRPLLALALALAITLHNLEEGLTFQRFGEPFAALLARWGVSVAFPPWSMMRVALVGATLVPIALIWISGRGPRLAWKDAILGGVATVFLVNVFVPHLIAAIVVGGYAPGIVTALILNLPLCSLVIRHVARGGLLAPAQLRMAMAAGAILLPLTTGTMLVIATMVRAGHPT